jgi:tetratricopeptide (TPR) repeat protein
VGADLALKGTLQRQGERVRITYSILTAPGGLQITADDVTGSASQLFSLQDELTARVAAGLNLSTRAGRTPTPSGLETASQQERYVQALGNLQRYDKPVSVDEAIRLLEGVAAERPEAALVQAGLGRAYLNKFNLTRDKSWAEKASDAVARARKLAPELPEVEATLGELLIRTGRPQDAVAAFRRALALQPNSFDVLLGLAKSYGATGDNARNAEEAYRRAIELQPSYWAGYSKLGGFYYKHGQYSSAVEMFAKVIQLSPDNARAYGNLGGAEFGRGRFPEALRAFEQSIRIEPTDLAYNNVGTLQYYLGRYGEAAAAFQKAIALLPGHYELWANLGDAYRLINDERKAREAYSRAISLAEEELHTNPLDGHVHSYLGLCLAKTGKPSEAEKHIRTSLSASLNNPEFLFNAAIVANEARRTDEAVARLRGAAAAGFNVAVIRSEPMLTNLRGRPDFQQIVKARKGNL